MPLPEDEFRQLHDRAYAAMERGALHEASRDFAALLDHAPEDRRYHYMRGLAHKYLLDWPVSLRHNLRAIALREATGEAMGEAEHWNAAIAATGLGDWSQARRLWAACGIRVPEGEGPIHGDYGVAVVRLNPWHAGETVWMRRIDPVRARLLNVPLPESGHRFADIVLHDGAATGHRSDGGHEVPVFNALQRLLPSEFQTHVVFVSCDRSEDMQCLLEASTPGIGHAEDWTDSVRHLCLRCSYGTPHVHGHDTINDDWTQGRNLGIAAQSRKSVEKLLKDWAAAGPGRQVDGIQTRECAVPGRTDGYAWWREPDDTSQDDVTD